MERVREGEEEKGEKGEREKKMEESRHPKKAGLLAYWTVLRQGKVPVGHDIFAVFAIHPKRGRLLLGHAGCGDKL